MKKKEIEKAAVEHANSLLNPTLNEHVFAGLAFIKGANFRQAEIDDLKKRIAKLEEINRLIRSRAKFGI